MNVLQIWKRDRLATVMRSLVNGERSSERKRLGASGMIASEGFCSEKCKKTVEVSKSSTYSRSRARAEVMTDSRWCDVDDAAAEWLLQRKLGCRSLVGESE